MSETKKFKPDIPADKIPQHIAIIMDGNGRWAERRGSARFAGHKAGVEAVRNVVQMCGEIGVHALTLFAFSSENWRRPKKEVGLLMDLFITALEREVNKLHSSNVQLRVIGELGSFPAKLQQRIREAMSLTAGNKGLVLNIAANYGGKWDITQAMQKIATRIASAELTPNDVNEETIAQHLCMSDLPEPDLFIRTGGEQRISNFLIWQLAYTELYFTDVLWPDFDQQAFAQALQSFAQRQRRFGHTGEQILQKEQRNRA
jgi:undecaprenyl diphosphate synthase